MSRSKQSKVKLSCACRDLLNLNVFFSCTIRILVFFSIDVALNDEQHQNQVKLISNHPQIKKTFLPSSFVVVDVVIAKVNSFV